MTPADGARHHSLGGWDDIPLGQRGVIVIMAVFAVFVVAPAAVLGLFTGDVTESPLAIDPARILVVECSRSRLPPPARPAR